MTKYEPQPGDTVTITCLVKKVYSDGAVDFLNEAASCYHFLPGNSSYENLTLVERPEQKVAVELTPSQWREVWDGLKGGLPYPVLVAIQEAL